MKRIGIRELTVVFLIAGRSAVAADVPVPRPLEVEVAHSEAIVVGKLVRISTPAAYSFSFHNLGENNYTMYWDSGVIEIESLLKGPDFLVSDKQARVMIYSCTQGNNPYGGCDRHPVGEEGLWLLRRDRYTGDFHFSGTKNPFPKSLASRVKRILGKR